jgi:hypothetical protein
MRKYLISFHTFSTGTFITINSYKSSDAANVEVISDHFNAVPLPVKNDSYR